MEVEVEAEQKRSRLTTPSASLTDIFMVSNKEGLLDEILARVDPPSLVRAALVCKKWYSVSSDLKFFNNFCKKQPRRLLGYFAMLEEGEKEFFLFKEAPEQAGVTCFRSVSFPQSISQALDQRNCVLEEVRELSCISRFLSSTFQEGSCDAMDYCSKRVLVKVGNALAICEPLRQKLSMLPPLLPLPYWRGDYAAEYFLFSEDALSAVHVTVTWLKMGRLGVDLAYLNGDQWTHDSNSIEFEQQHRNPLCHPAILANGCIFMLTVEGSLIVVNLEGCTISKVGLPSEICYPWGSHHMCKAQGADFIYLHADGYDIQLWLYNQESWIHCGTINLPYVFAHSNIPWTAVDWHKSTAGWGEVITIYGVGDAAEFVFLGIGGIEGLFLLDVGSSIVIKVGEKASEEKGDLIGNRIIPFITSCCPVLPQMSEDNIDTKRLENAVVEQNKNLIDQLVTISLDEKCVKKFIKTRYPSTSSLIWNIDDCLTVLYSVAALPTVEVTPDLQHRIDNCCRLTRQWEKYILQSSSLRKKVASVNGIYFQAEVNGQTVTWRSPLAGQVADDFVGFNLTVNLLIFYENCMELLLESLNNRAGTSKKRDAQLELVPNFQYSETVKRLRSLNEATYDLESIEKVKEIASGCVEHANV